MRFDGASFAQTALVLLGAAGYVTADNASTTPYWLNPRVAVIQNTLVIEGGIRTQGNYSNGVWSAPTLTSSPGGRLYYMSLCSSFNTATDNIDALAQRINESNNPSMNSWTGGALFATEYEWYTFGGLPQSRRRSTDINVLQANMYLPDTTPSAVGWSAGINDQYPPEYSANVSNNLAMGAWTNAPSEKLGFWFSGLQSPSGGIIDSLVNANKSDQANTTSRTFIKVDMSAPTRARWQNMTWPDWLAPRSEGGLVWLPYGGNGILVAFGGIDLPGDLGSSNLFLNSTALLATNSYMTNLAVYDIATDTWALQSTLESISPPQMAQFCTVTASAADNSSHFIYVYGGYDGTFHAQAVYDSIWVLSVPAFQWTKLADGTSAHRRFRHSCVLPNPTQMLSIGGGTEKPMLTNPDWLDVYDLNSGSWTHTYNATSTATYKVPGAITSQIGGTADGGFNIPSTGLNSTVSKMLNTKYKKLIPGYSPYNWCAPNSTVPANGSTTVGNSTTTVTSTASATGNPNKTPSWQTPVIAVLATVAGLAILGAIFFFCCMRGRKDENGNRRRSRIISWREKSNPHQSSSNPDSETTHVEQDYFRRKDGTHELSSNVTSPGYGPHGLATMVGSPSSGAFGGEMESSARHEIMTNPQRDSMSIGQHPYYPHSIQGDFINRSVAGSESISSPSMGPVPSTLAANVHSRGHGQKSPFELAHDRSHENLPSPPLDDRTLDISSEGGDSSVFGAHNQMKSPIAMSPGTTRKPVNVSPMVRPVTPLGSGELRPSHHHQNSTSSDMLTLPSPTPAEDQRRSRMINDLPDLQGISPVIGHSQQPTKKASGPLRSAYQEKFD